MEKQYIKHPDGTYYRINAAGEKQQLIKSGIINFWSGRNTLISLSTAEHLAIPAGVVIPYYPQADSDRHYKYLLNKYPALKRL